MKTLASPHPAIDLSPEFYDQIVRTLTDLLPPPLDDSPDALRARNHAAIAKVAAMLPVGANEADLAAQCIVARAQAEDVMRLIRANAHNVAWVIRLSAQYTAMVRTSLSVQTILMRVQAVRQKREAIEASATQDAWTQHVAERSMLKVADPGIEQVTAASPRAAPADAPQAAPAARMDQAIEDHVSQSDTNSHDVAFETRVSAPLGHQGPGRPDETAARPGAVPAPHTDQTVVANVSKYDADSHTMAFETQMSAPCGNQGADLTVVPPAPVVAPAQAAPAQPAARPAPSTAVAAAPNPSPLPARAANPRDGLLWADAMRVVAKEMSDGLSALPPALRKQEAMRAQLLRSVAMDIAARAGSAGAPRRTGAVRKT